MKPKKMVILGMFSSSNMSVKRIFRWNAINPFDPRCFKQMFTSSEYNIITYVADYAKESTKIEFPGLHTWQSNITYRNLFLVAEFVATGRVSVE